MAFFMTSPIEPAADQPHPSVVGLLLGNFLTFPRRAPQALVADQTLTGTWALRYLVDHNGIPQLLPDEIAEHPVTITSSGVLSFDFGGAEAVGRVLRKAKGRLVSGHFSDMPRGAAAWVERGVARAFLRAEDAVVINGQMSVMGRGGEVLAVLVRW